MGWGSPNMGDKVIRANKEMLEARVMIVVNAREGESKVSPMSLLGDHCVWGL